jgi:hypothetical protein
MINLREGKKATNRRFWCHLAGICTGHTLASDKYILISVNFTVISRMRTRKLRILKHKTLIGYESETHTNASAPAKNENDYIILAHKPYEVS